MFRHLKKQSRTPASAASWSIALAVGLLVGFGCPQMASANQGGEVVAVRSQLGGYLAGRVARGQSDTLSAASFYGQALSKDAGNEALAIQTFDMEATEGNWPRAEALALELYKAKSDHRMSRFFLGLAEFKKGKFVDADDHFKASAINPIGELTSLLARAWLRQAEGKTKDALELIDTTKQPDWAQALIRYHRALIADVGSRRQEAKTTFERLFAGEQKSLRSTLAYAQSLSSAGDNRAAERVMKTYFDKIRGEGHPSAVALQKQLVAGEKTQLLVMTASQGLSEALFGLGEALAGEGGIGPGAVFLQYALYLEPRFPFALAALANVYESTKRYERAIEVYEQIVPGTPLEQAIDIRKAYDLNSLDRVEEAKMLLEQVADRDPMDLKPLDALGAIMRGHKRYEEAIGYYSRAIAIIKKPEARHWSYFYARGTSYERVHKWPLAEADLQTALKLSPDEGTVLNYLGYSWVDQNRNLKTGMQLIEKAVKLKPDDGYIVDSLGWAHFRIGNFKEAVRWLERAVELRPDDPILNDHLGDALWRVGREREAAFQWNQALTLKPEPDDSEKIQKKLKSGLPTLAKAVIPKRNQQAQKQDQPRKRAETRNAPATAVPQ
jgi:tetratricopeptide (TPR) repeat protein